jgi:hypothetical protein
VAAWWRWTPHAKPGGVTPVENLTEEHEDRFVSLEQLGEVGQRAKPNEGGTDANEDE